MNLKSDILKSYASIFNTEKYNRPLAYETQKPKSTTYLKVAIENKNQLSKTTGGTVYSVDVSFSYYTNSEMKLTDEIDKITNILDKYHSYRDTTKTYFFNALMTGIIFNEDEEWKFQITLNLTYEEVA